MWGFYKLLFRLMGWRLDGSLPNIQKYILIVAPHTSNWDFVIGIITRGVLNVRMSYLGKKELFKPPFGWLFRWLGGHPVDRSSSKNLVDAVAEIFKKEPTFVLALAPEGTRTKVVEWKTGFYHMAVQAHVPIVGVGFDYSRKLVVIQVPFYPSGDIDQDLPSIQAKFQDIKGKNS